MSSIPDESIVLSGIQLPGERLLVAREELGLSQQVIADELHLPVRYIQWIEDGCFDKLPSLVFARGYMRGYAKIVGIDGSSLIEIFNQSIGWTTKTEPIRSVTRVQQQVKLGDPVMRWSGWFFLIIFVSVVGWWWKTQYSLAPTEGVKSDESVIPAQMTDDNTLVLPKFEEKSAESAASAQMSDDNTLILPKFEDDVAVSEESDTEGVSKQIDIEEPQYLSEEDVISVQGNVSPAVTEVSVPVNDNIQARVVAPISEELQMSFTDDCWLTVKNADGKTLFNGLRKQGQSLSLTGKEPLRVLVGRVSAINQVLYKGVVVDLTPYNDKNVAKFSLPLN